MVSGKTKSQRISATSTSAHTRTMWGRQAVRYRWQKYFYVFYGHSFSTSNFQTCFIPFIVTFVSCSVSFCFQIFVLVSVKETCFLRYSQVHYSIIIIIPCDVPCAACPWLENDWKMFLEWMNQWVTEFWTLETLICSFQARPRFSNQGQRRVISLSKICTYVNFVSNLAGGKYVGKYYIVINATNTKLHILTLFYSQWFWKEDGSKAIFQIIKKDVLVMCG